MSRFLIIDDDLASCRTLQLHFQSQGHSVVLAHNLEDGLERARKTAPELTILDIRMPGRNGLEGLPELKERLGDGPVIVITAYHDMDTTIEAMKGGADDYIHKPVDIDELDAAIGIALDRLHANGNDVPLLQRESGKPGANTMVGRSRAMREVFKTIGLVAPQAVTVLITGESGTGKELVARAIHQAGANPAGPFVAVNCAAIVETLLESDLFGHEKGAFTGAISRQPGKFALANDGTVFLDEISELSLAVQAKLLRVLQEREYLPVGGSQLQRTNARVIAASNVDLQEWVEKGSFREDLYYRLQVVTIDMPPLRERKEDMLDLVQVLLARINKDMHRKVTRVAMDVMAAFHAYQWPGNVRELENVLMKAVALCTGDAITMDLLPREIVGGYDSARPCVETSSLLSLQEVEKSHVARVLAATSWHKGHACDILRVSRPRLRRLIKQYGLTPPEDLPAPEADEKAAQPSG